MDFAMYFWFKLFCLISILNIVIMIQLPDKPGDTYIFSYITLGHSGFLISWKPKVPQKDKANKLFKFRLHIKDNQRNKNFIFSKFVWMQFNQIKIDSLKENTHYEVIIEQYRFDYRIDMPSEISYSFDMKTKQKTNTKPAKPDFKWSPIGYYDLNIRWYPCGGEENCIGREAGTHFAVKFNPLDKRGEYRIEEYFNDYFNQRLIPGILYEMTVISINNDLETESDPQEIFFIPTYGTVKSVRVKMLSNATVSVSWKPPKYSASDGFFFMYHVIFMNNSIRNDYSLYTENFMSGLNKGIIKSTEIRFGKSQYRLEPGKTYSVFILSCTNWCRKAGVETLVKFTIPLNMDDLFSNGQKSVLLNTGKSP